MNDLFHCSPNIPHYAKNKAVGTMKPGMVKSCHWNLPLSRSLTRFPHRSSPSNPCVSIQIRSRQTRPTFSDSLDRCSISERVGKRSIGRTIGPQLRLTAGAALSSKRLYCPSSPLRPFPEPCANLHASITETGVEVLTAGKSREDLQ